MRWLAWPGELRTPRWTTWGGRTAFGSRLGDLGRAQQLIADNEIDLAALARADPARRLVLDTGGSGRHETSITKTFVAEAVGRVVDRSVAAVRGQRDLRGPSARRLPAGGAGLPDL